MLFFLEEVAEDDEAEEDEDEDEPPPEEAEEDEADESCRARTFAVTLAIAMTRGSASFGGFPKRMRKLVEVSR